MKTLRFTVGRWLIHFGWCALPPGKVKDELREILTAYANHIYTTIGKGNDHA